ncbi:MAG: DUF1573 domain-containing protein [Planctomycetaceae bacterium]|nr:DUF1573 domain-containing protein [Planctomycetaceae bacterium]
MRKLLSKTIAAWAVLLCGAPLVCLAQNTEWAMKMFEESSHDFGVVAKGSAVQHRLKVTNIYNETVHIADVKTSCGCTAAKPSQNTLNSLESAYIEVVMDTVKFSRQKDSSIIVTFDSPQRAEIRIPISAYIRTDVVIEPGSVNFNKIDKGAGAERSIDISYAGRGDWNIRDVENLPSFMTANLTEVSRSTSGVSYKLQVVVADTAPVGPFRGQLNLITDDASNPRIPLLVEGEVISDIVVNNDLVSLGVLRPGQEKTVNVVIRGKQPFKIGKVECSSDLNAFQVRLPEDERNVQVLPLTILTPNGSGTIVEEFTVTIDGREEPIKFKAYCKVVSGS